MEHQVQHNMAWCEASQIKQVWRPMTSNIHYHFVGSKFFNFVCIWASEHLSNLLNIKYMQCRQEHPTAIQILRHVLNVVIDQINLQNHYLCLLNQSSPVTSITAYYQIVICEKQMNMDDRKRFEQPDTGRLRKIEKTKSPKIDQTCELFKKWCSCLDGCILKLWTVSAAGQARDFYIRK